MRRIPHLRKPSAVLAQCLHTSASTPQRTAVCRAATSCLTRRPRDFSTTPDRPLSQSRAWADKPKTEPLVEAGESQIPVGAETRSGAEEQSHPTRTTKAVQAEDDFLEPEEPESSSPEQQAGTSGATDAVSSTSGPVAIETDLVLPPTDRTVAPRPTDLDPENEAYEPANTADGLDVIGGLKGWFDPAADPARDHWGSSKRFVAFAPAAKVTEPALLELCTARAVLEAVALDAFLKRKGLGRGTETLLADTWRNDGLQGFNRVLAMQCVITEDGQVEVGASAEAVARGLEANAQTGDAAATVSMPPVQEAVEILRSWNLGWRRISLEDVKLKFAVAKRVYQLTGHAIPDIKLLHVHCAGQLLALIVAPPPPRTVYEAVQQRGELSKLPNVTIHEKRRTPVDEAKSVGRWKIIEEELNRRGLPVLGKDKVDGFKEREWYRGPKPDKKNKRRRR